MRQDEIIKMAREAELAYDIDAVFTFKGNFAQLEAFAKLIAQTEREACAKVCEEIAQESDAFTEGILRMTATEIRTRGEA